MNIAAIKSKVIKEVIKVIINITVYIVYFIAFYYFVLESADNGYYALKIEYAYNVLEQHKRDDTVLSPEETKRLRQLEGEEEKQQHYDYGKEYDYDKERAERDELQVLREKYYRSIPELFRKAYQEYKKNNSAAQKEMLSNVQTNMNIFLVISFFLFVVLFNHTHVKMFFYSLPFLSLTLSLTLNSFWNYFEIVDVMNSLYFVVAFSVTYILSWLTKRTLKKVEIRFRLFEI